MAESDIILKAGGVRFKFVVHVMPRELELACCPVCEGRGKTGTVYMDDDIQTCGRCQGQGKVRSLYFVFPDLEEHLKECMDKYLEEKYPKRKTDVN